MATPTFAVNGGPDLPGVNSNWQRLPKRKNTDGTIEYLSWALNTWHVPEMSMANFETLQAMSGAVLISLDTTDIDDRNNGAQYTDAELDVVNGRHVGLRVLDVRLAFRVKVA